MMVVMVLKTAFPKALYIEFDLASTCAASVVYSSYLY